MRLWAISVVFVTPEGKERPPGSWLGLAVTEADALSQAVKSAAESGVTWSRIRWHSALSVSADELREFVKEYF